MYLSTSLCWVLHRSFESWNGCTARDVPACQFRSVVIKKICIKSRKMELPLRQPHSLSRTWKEVLALRALTLWLGVRSARYTHFKRGKADFYHICTKTLFWSCSFVKNIWSFIFTAWNLKGPNNWLLWYGTVAKRLVGSTCWISYFSIH